MLSRETAPMSYRERQPGELISSGNMEVPQMKPIPSLAVLAIGGLLLAGCNPNKDQPEPTAAEDQTTAPAAPADMPPPADPGAVPAPGETPLPPPPDTTNPTDPNQEPVPPPGQ